MIDYMIGRRVMGITSPLHKTDWTWAIELESGIRIVHTGNNKKPSNAIEGTVLGTAVEEGTKTRMGFYGGSEPTFVEAVAVPTKNLRLEYPEGYEAPQTALQGAVDPSKDLPPDPSQHRIAGGPLDEVV
jgi:hypothetical protein